MNTKIEKGLLGLSVLLAMFYIVVALGSQVSGDFSSIGERVGWAFGGFLSGAFILAGLRLSKREPLVGGLLVVVGAIPLGFFMWWLIVVPIVALTVAVFGVVRACGFASKPGHLGTSQEAQI